MQNFEKPFKSLCIKECPKFDYAAIKNPTKSAKYEGPIFYEEFSKNYAGLSHTNDPKFNHHEGLSFDEGFANKFYTE